MRRLSMQRPVKSSILPKLQLLLCVMTLLVMCGMSLLRAFLTEDVRTRLEQLRRMILENQQEMSAFVALELQKIAAEKEAANRQASRIALVLSSAIGLAMASHSTGGAVPTSVKSILGMETAVERSQMLRGLSMLRDGLVNATAATALTLSETCAITWSVLETVLTAPPPVPPNPPIPLVRVPRQQVGSFRPARRAPVLPTIDEQRRLDFETTLARPLPPPPPWLSPPSPPPPASPPPAPSPARHVNKWS